MRSVVRLVSASIVLVIVSVLLCTTPASASLDRCAAYGCNTNDDCRIQDPVHCRFCYGGTCRG
jgi:hypothetical protein